MKKTFFLLIVVLLVAGHQGTNAQQITPFKKGDKVAFVGNSITDGGRYHSFIWLYYMTRFPNDKLTIINCGIGGDTAADIYKRLDGDVFCHRPNVISLTFGMNDSGYFEYNGDNPQAFADKKVTESYENYKLIEKRLQTLPDTRIVLLGSSPYDETAIIEKNNPFKNKNKAMLRIVDFQKKSAEANNWEFLDYNEPMTKLNEQKQQEDPAFALCGNDRIHPDNDGHMVMAYLFLRSQGFAGKEVADVVIDAKKKTASKSVNASISDIKLVSGKLSFDYLAGSLPYPMDTLARGWGSKKSQADVVKVVPFIEEMNKEMLTVSGLKGKYELTIDGASLGEYSDSELAAGINLATNIWAPQYQQALKVMMLNEERWDIERRFRDYAWVQFGFFQKRGMLFANDRQAVEEYDKEAVKDGWLRARRDLYSKAIHQEVRDMWKGEMDNLVSRIYEINKPVTRKVVLTPVK